MTGRKQAIGNGMRGLSNEDLMMLSAYSLNSPVTVPSEMAEPVKTEYTADTTRGCAGNRPSDPKLLQLEQRLLSFGGNSVCLPGEEEDLENIMRYGQLWYGKTVKMKKGRPSRCHSNSAELYSANRDALTDSRLMICTGYALSEDGMWRQHSWLAWIKARSVTLVETTVPRVAYFGFCMTGEQCEEFVYNNT